MKVPSSWLTRCPPGSLPLLPRPKASSQAGLAHCREWAAPSQSNGYRPLPHHFCEPGPTPPLKSAPSPQPEQLTGGRKRRPARGLSESPPPIGPRPVQYCPVWCGPVQSSPVLLCVQTQRSDRTLQAGCTQAPCLSFPVGALPAGTSNRHRTPLHLGPQGERAPQALLRPLPGPTMAEQVWTEPMHVTTGEWPWPPPSCLTPAALSAPTQQPLPLKAPVIQPSACKGWWRNTPLSLKTPSPELPRVQPAWPATSYHLPLPSSKTQPPPQARRPLPGLGALAWPGRPGQEGQAVFCAHLQDPRLPRPAPRSPVGGALLAGTPAPHEQVVGQVRTAEGPSQCWRAARERPGLHLCLCTRPGSVMAAAGRGEGVASGQRGSAGTKGNCWNWAPRRTQEARCRGGG